MTGDMTITLLILGVAMVFFITEWLRVDVVALGVLTTLIATRILTAEEAITGFSSTTVVSIGALFIVGGAVFHTGLADMIADRILKVAGTNETRLLAILMLTVALMSAFISSTGVVALMLPAVISLSKRAKLSVGRLLIPLSYSALLGGATTLIGTPPNIIATETLTNAGYSSFGFLSFTPLGLLLIVACIGLMLALSGRLLPKTANEPTQQQMETPEQLFALYRLPDNLFRLRVRAQSPLAGKPIQAMNLRERFNVNIVNVTRVPHNGNRDTHRTEIYAPPAPDLVLQPEDILVVQGAGNDVGRAAGYWNLAISANEPVKQGDLITNEVGIAEVLLRPRSSFIGKTLPEVRFGSVFRLTVLDIHRPGHEGKLDLKETPLKFGDLLLVQGEWRDIFGLKRLRHDFIVMGEPEAAQTGAFSRRSHAPIALALMVLMVVAIAFNFMSLTLASLVAALGMVILGCLTMDEAYAAIDWRSIMLIGGMIPMSTALVKVGMVDKIADGVTDTLGGSGPLLVMIALFVLTALFTQTLSNTVTTVLMAPIALAIAEGMAVRPQAFVMTVAVAASLAFMTPIASPVNTLVMSAGNYRFKDYVKAGTPLLLISAVLVIVVVPLLFPFD